MRIRNILLSAFILALFGCATKYYTNEESSFYEYLEKNYRTYADYKRENYDWKGARLFYKKADKIRNGKEVEPEKASRMEDVINFVSKDITYEEFSDMRNRMLLILNDNNSKQSYPEEVANMQFYYDCWVLEEELYTRYGQIARCKQGFVDTLSYLEFKLLKIGMNERDLIKKDIDNDNVEVEVFIRPKKYIIYFDFDSSALNEDSSRVLWEFLNDAKKINGNYIVNVVGHADRTGSSKYNKTLSKRRSDTIKHYLVKNGIPENIIQIKWQGDIEPQVITNNNFKETLNRRVVITIKTID